MVTIKDIAKVAGVSQGTVSNVLNQKGNVSAQKIQLVQAAAKQLGYQLNSQAQLLRKGRSNDVLIWIPYAARHSYQTVYQTFYHHFRSQARQLVLTYIHDVRELPSLVDKAVALAPEAVICVGFELAPSYLRLLERETQVLLMDVYSKTVSGIPSFSFDFPHFYKEIHALCQRQDMQRIVLLHQGWKQQASKLWKLGEALESDKELTVYHCYQDEQITGLLQDIPTIEEMDMIVVEGEETCREIERLLDWLCLRPRPQILTLRDDAMLRDDSPLSYQFDFTTLSLQVLAYMEQTSFSSLPKQGLVETQKTISVPFQKRLRLLTLKSQMSQALTILTSRYKAETGVEIEVVALSYRELFEVLKDTEAVAKEFDLIRLDVAQLKTVGVRLFQPIWHSEQLAAIRSRLTENYPDEYSYVNGEQLALPLDVSTQLLFYRKDLFDNALYQRQYMESYKQGLHIPNTFEEYDRIAAFFSQELNPSSPVAYGHSLALSFPLSAACDFLPRLREKAVLSANLSMEEHFEQTLQEYRKSLKTSDGQMNYWWNDVASNFATGKTAMEILFTNYAPGLVKRLEVQGGFELGVALIPGKQPLLGGGCLGISKGTAYKKEAMDYLSWLYSDEIARMLAFLGGLTLHKAVKSHPDIARLYPWLEDMEKSMAFSSRYRWQGKELEPEYEVSLGQIILSQMKEGNGSGQ